jgi:hypothetical protein
MVTVERRSKFKCDWLLFRIFNIRNIGKPHKNGRKYRYFEKEVGGRTSFRNIVFEIEERTMVNVKNCDGYKNIPSSYTYR